MTALAAVMESLASVMTPLASVLPRLVRICPRCDPARDYLRWTLVNRCHCGTYCRMNPSFSQLGQWLTGLWQSPDFVLMVVPVATSIMAAVGMYVLWRFSRLRHTPGMHYSPKAAQWAAGHFPEFQPPVAA